MNAVQLRKYIQENGLEALGLFYGKYRGFVKDRNDPLKLGRVRLSVPQVWGESVTHDYWAYPFGIYAETGAGFFVLPAVGEMVWVEFERGDPNAPIWTYGHFGKNDPPAATANDYGENYIFATRKGYYLEINETQKTVILAHSNGEKIVLNDTAGGGVSIVRGGKKIALGALDGAAEPVVLGDKNFDALTGITGQIKNIITQLNALIAALQTEATAFGAAVPALAPAAGAFVTAAGAIITALGIINGSVVFLENNDFPATKSQNVTTD